MTLTICETADKYATNWRKIHPEPEVSLPFPTNYRAIQFLQDDTPLTYFRDFYAEVNEKELCRMLIYGKPPHCSEGQPFTRGSGINFQERTTNILFMDLDKHPALPGNINNTDIKEVALYCLEKLGIAQNIGFIAIGSGSFGMKNSQPRIRLGIQLNKAYTLEKISESLKENNIPCDMSVYRQKTVIFCSPPSFLQVSPPCLARGRVYFRDGGLLSLSDLKKCNYTLPDGKAYTNTGDWSQWKEMKWRTLEEARAFLYKLKEEGKLEDRRWGLVMFMGRAFHFGIQQEIIDDKEIQDLCEHHNLEEKLKASLDNHKSFSGLKSLDEAFRSSEIKRINSLDLSKDTHFEKIDFLDAITVIKSPKGTGKSKASLNIWNNFRLKKELAKGVYVGTLKSTVLSMAHENDWSYYNGDEEDANTLTKRNIAKKAVFLATTDQSFKYDETNRDIVIFDESEDIINNIIAGKYSLEHIIDVCMRAGTIIFMDADASYYGTGQLIELLRQITQKKIQYVLNTGDWGRTANHYFINNKWEAINNIIKLIKEGNRVFVPYDRADKSSDGYPQSMLRSCIETFTDKRAIAFHANSSNKEAFEKDVENYLIDEIENKDCRCLILSPAYYRSFSFLGTPGAHFNIACGIFTTPHRTHEMLDQFLSRCRRAMDKYIYIGTGCKTLDADYVYSVRKKFVKYGNA